MKRSAPDWTELRRALWMRCEGFCEVSGIALDQATFDAHHRRPKAMGGTYRDDTDTLPNLLALAPLVHNLHPRSVHGAPEWSRPRGYLLPKNADPAVEPVLYRGRLWAVLTEDGGYSWLNDRSQRYLWRTRVPAGPPRKPGLSQYR